jgi:DNA-binding NtrC family response regulator
VAQAPPLAMLPPVVLLVEGDIVVRHSLAEYLRECGFTVFEASNGDEAMQALSTPELRIMVVLADMATTGSGFALRRRIVEQNLSVELILAGSIEKAVDQASNLCNEGPALGKPYQHHLVRDQIRQALARRDRDKKQDNRPCETPQQAPVS